MHAWYACTALECLFLHDYGVFLCWYCQCRHLGLTLLTQHPRARMHECIWSGRHLVLHSIELRWALVLRNVYSSYPLMSSVQVRRRSGIITLSQHLDHHDILASAHPVRLELLHLGQMLCTYCMTCNTCDLHASSRCPNLKVKLTNAREEFRTVWRGYQMEMSASLGMGSGYDHGGSSFHDYTQ